MNRFYEALEAPDRRRRAWAGALVTPHHQPSGTRRRRAIPMPSGERRVGRPLDGYLGTIILVFLAFFIVGKSAGR